MDKLYNASNIVQKITLAVFANYSVTGKERVPLDEPLIIVANHQSNLDPAFLSPSIPRRIRFLAKDSIFRVPIANWFLRAYGAFPLKRDAVDVTAHRWSVAHLQSGGALTLFPEGTRNPRGMGRAHAGVARLALTTKVRLLPVGITGTERLGSVLRVFNPTGRIRMSIGEPFALPHMEGKPSKPEMEAITTMIMRRIAAQLPPEYRGVYSLEDPTGDAN